MPIWRPKTKTENAGFEAEFFNWLDRSLRQPIPETVVAFAFNLNEHAHQPQNFSLELIGAPTFDPDKSDWACDDIFNATPKTIYIPNSFSGETWEDCLQVITKLISDYLARNSNGANLLKSAQAIGVGFVDGDLHLIKY